MIRIQAVRDGQGVRSVRVSGHSGYDEAGRDIVCAAVTSAVQMTANGLTEVLCVSAEASVLEDAVSLIVPKDRDRCVNAFLEALVLHLTILSEEYRENIDMNVTEVNDDD